MKTEEPTPRRLRRARELGDAPVSSALGQALSLMTVVLLAPAALLACGARAAALLRAALAGTPAADPARTLVVEVVSLSAPLLLAVAATAAAVGLWQTGAVLSATRLTPDFGRLDPVAGARNLFKADRLFALVRALVAAGAAGCVALLLLRAHAADFAETTGNELAVGALALSLGRTLGTVVALVGVALGLVDLVIVHRLWRSRHRMSKDEVRREFREAEGDPELRAKRRRAHQEALAGSIVNAVRDATVVVVNPTHLASALRYVEEEDAAPRVVAQGEGDLARYIVEAARAYGIPCVRDVPVARALRELEIGDEIPEALYEAVAEILRELTEHRDANE
ncbi:MAG TPA: EscU/YscU/HrcU family type III secretion system export apparatus switch protein [Polyangiaceae bacterium]|nr:EscU/YscU/HrcU family type III secretion system export apparatus switch protein [Polyangiaceae bacterium]